MGKERINPSAGSSYKKCAFHFYVTRELGLTTPTRALTSHLLTGLLFHAASASFDEGAFVKKTIGPEWREAIKSALDLIRTAPDYDPRQTFLVDYLAKEINFLMGGGSYVAADGKRYEPETSHEGGYMSWRREIQERRNWEIVSLEQRYAADLGPGIIAPKPDGVIREKGKLWVIERKTTQSDSPNFVKRFRIDLQTTLECMAVERYYDEEVLGVYLLPVFYTRKRSEKWTLDFPQPIHRVTFADPRPINKGPRVTGATELWFNQFITDLLPFHRRQKLWPQNFKSCLFGSFPCNLYDVCWENLELKDLIPARYDDLNEALYKLERD